MIGRHGEQTKTGANEIYLVSAVPNPWAASSIVLGREPYNNKYFVHLK